MTTQMPTNPISRNTVVLVALASTMLLTACGRKASSAPKPATPVRVVAAQPVEAARGHRYSASVQPEAQVSVSFRSSGYVDEIRQVNGRPLQPGDVVAKGTLLAAVNPADTAARLAQSAASLAEAEASAEKARLDLARAEKLFAAASLTRPELDAARAASRVGEARVAAARAQRDAAQVAHADTRLVAPWSGVVLARSVEEGALVAPGSVGFVLADTRTVKAVFGVPDGLVQRLALGDRIPVAAQAVPDIAFDGRITAIAPSADPASRVFDVEVTIPNAAGRLKSGMVAAVELLGGEPAIPNAALPAVPLSAVLKSPKDGGYAVLVVAQGVARVRPVKLGAITANQVVVVEGLAPRESVVVTGASLLADGEAVRVIP